MRFNFRTLGFLLVFASLPAWADCELKELPKSPSDAMEALSHNRNSKCLGNPNEDDVPITKKIKQLTPPNLTLKEELAGVNQSLVELNEYAVARSKTAPDNDDWANLALEIDRVAKLLAKMSPDQSLADYTSKVDLAFTGQWATILNSNTNFNQYIVLNNHPIHPFRPISQCSAAECSEYINRLDLVRVIRLMSNVQSYATDDSLKARLIIADRESKRWEAYRANALHQYPWELVVNGWAMDRDKKICPRDSNRARIGFCSVPTEQWIVLHPDVGVRWANGASNSSELRPAFVIETIGYYGWRWESESSAEMKNRMGASIAAVYSKEVPGGSRWAYGPMFHLGDYNFAITKARGENWGITVNVLLADRILAKQNQVEELQKFIQ